MNGQQAQQIEKEAQNMPLEIGFKRLSDNAILPTKAHASDSGFDLFAANDVIIAPGETVVVPSDIAVQLPQGYEAQVRPRSGITSRTKLRVAIGTIDNDFTGNVGIIVDNISQKFLHEETTHTKFMRYVDGSVVPPKIGDYHLHDTYYIEKGTKLAQLVVQPIPATVAVEITVELGDSDRGAAGFGSSGV